VTRFPDLEPSDDGQWLVKLAHHLAHLSKAQKQENKMNLNRNNYVRNLKQPFSQLTPPKISMKKALEVGIPYMRVIQLTHSTSRIWITSLLVLMGVFFAHNVIP